MKINLPFPQRLKKVNEDVKISKFSSMFKSLAINIPLMDALLKISYYAKFMKELVTKKQNLEFDTIEVSHHCSVVMSSNMLAKENDPNAFTNPCSIHVYRFSRALCNLGASINLMLHYSCNFFWKLLVWKLLHQQL